ncbi:type I pullulanase [Clostridium thermarum]|uniref:type I pullulanase n=1 Tax=Clostridium thermarum TaxID=1716543 RepID=UPI0013D697A1|nr:type I pullulanase [Clostridium thermarum]
MYTLTEPSDTIEPMLTIEAPQQLPIGGRIPLKAIYTDEHAVQTEVEATWSVLETDKKVFIEGNELVAAEHAEDKATVTVQAFYNGKTATKIIEIVQMYSFTINYYRYDGKAFSDWGLWLWEDGRNGALYTFTEETEEGFARATFTFPFKKLNFITRAKSDWSAGQEGGDRFVEVTTGTSTEIWLRQGDVKVYYSPIDISARVMSAMADSLTDIYAVTSGSIADLDVATFQLIDVEEGATIPVNAIKLGDNKVKLSLQEGLIDVTKQYEVKSQAYAAGKVTMRKILDNPKYYYSGDDLGVTYTPAGSIFKLWAPTAKSVSLATYDSEGVYNESGKVVDHTGGSETAMVRGDNGVWSLEVKGDLAGKYYMYKVEFADGKVNYAVDPYAKAVSANGQRGVIIDLSKTNPENFNPNDRPTMIKPTDAIIYEMHVRDFSIDPNSGIDNKGRFKAFTESGTTLDGDESIKTGIDHLKELGITHVHLLPSYDYATVNEKSSDPQYNWGYDPQNYNVPEGSYSSDADDAAVRVTEFKEMVQALHDNGISVVMDVVYNHTFSTGNSSFDLIVPGYYYRTDDFGGYTNGSGVGNEVASERPMVRKFIKDSVKYWSEEYGVDGFRFDLMGLIDTTTMTQIVDELKNEINPSVLIYGEPWTGGSSPLAEQTLKGSQKEKGFAVFNDNIRGAIKGGSDDATKGFASGEPGKETDIVKGIRGAIDDFTNSPTETINYVTAHDNLNLWDKFITARGLAQEVGFLNIKDGKLVDGGSVEDAVNNADPYKNIDLNNVLDNETVKRTLLANGIVFTSQGIPFIQAGDEFLRTKYGDHNSYKSPDAINMIRWQNKADFKPVFDYYQGLIELRKSHPAFRMDTKEAINSNLVVLKQDGNVVVFQLKNYANGDDWKNIVVIYNGNKSVTSMDLPFSSTWKVVVDHSKAGTQVIREVKGNRVSVEGLSLMVLYDEASETYTPTATTIELSKAFIGLEKGTSTYVTAVVRDQKGKIMPNAQVQWSSSADEIVTVDQKGKITAKQLDGTAEIKVQCGSAESTMRVSVANLVPTSITISGSNIVYATRSTTLTALVKDQFEQPMSDRSVTWTSSDLSKAVVTENGEVTGIAAGTVTITAQAGNASSTIAITVKPNVKRYVYFRYIRPNNDYDDWNIWVWNTGVKNDMIEFESVTEEGAFAKIEIAPETTWIGFVLRKGLNWEQKDTIDYDRKIITDLNSTIIKVTVTTGVGEFFTTPAVSGPVLDNGNLTFYYRDAALFAEDKMETLKGVKVKVNGQTYDMEYKSLEELYTYTMNLTREGTYEYTFLVTDENGNTREITDPVNTVDGVSKVVYAIPKLNISATVAPSVIDYNQNAVLSLNVTSEENVKIREAYLDLRELGGKEKVNVDTELMAQAIAVKDSITAGEKNIPITIIDEFGNTHHSAASVTVKARQSVGNTDFDWDEARIYFMLTDRFNNGDTSNDSPNGVVYDKTHLETYHGGDFKGITQKLDYLKDLGINTIWITPIVDNIDFNQAGNWTDSELSANDKQQYAYHGYWAKDFGKIDEHLGSMDDFKELIDEAHSRGIKIMLDVVINHAGYGMRTTDTNTNNLDNYPTDEEKAKFEGMFRPLGSSDQVTGDLSGLPDFKTEDPDVRNKLIEWQTDWINRLKTHKGNTIDYFRVDTVNNVENTTWKALKNAVTTINPGFKLIGEAYNANINQDGGQLRSGQMDSILDFSFKWSALNFVNGQIDGVEDYMEEINEKIDNTASLGIFLSSHDEDGFLTRLSGTDEEKIAKLKAAVALQMTAKGQPVVYYGEELGASGRTANNMSSPDGNFSENRYDMPWDRLNNPMYSSLYKHYKTMLNIRAGYSKVFAKGTRTKIAGGDAEKYLVFDRTYEGKSLVIAINTDITSKNITVTVPFAAGSIVRDLYSEREFTVTTDKKVTFTLPAIADGATVILAEASKNSTPDTPTPSAPSDASVTNSDSSVVISVINSVTNNGTVTVDITNNKKVAKEIFDAIKGTEKTVIFKQNGVEWTFSGKDITGTTKAIDMSVIVSSINNTATGNKADIAKAVNNESVLVISFANNGQLPGKAKVRIMLDAAWLVSNDRNNINIYYYNEATKKLEAVVNGLKADAEGYVEFEINHNSDYVVSSKNLLDIPSEPKAPTIERTGGANRYETAVKVSQAGWTTSANVVLARGDEYADALTAAPFAKQLNAPILLTPTNTLDASVKAELIRLGAKKVYIIGGTGAVSAAVQNTIKTMGITVERIGGRDRYETSLAVANKMKVKNQVFLVTGRNYPDALSISSYAAATGSPILLTAENQLTAGVSKFIKDNNSKVYVIGGTGVISEAAVKGITRVERIGGTDRYDTNLAVLKKFTDGYDFSNIYLATGSNYPDAICGSALAGSEKAPIILVDSKYITSQKPYIKSIISKVSKVKVLGGEGVITSGTVHSILNN